MGIDNPTTIFGLQFFSVHNYGDLFKPHKNRQIAKKTVNSLWSFKLLHSSSGTACFLIFSHPPPGPISATN